MVKNRDKYVELENKCLNKMLCVVFLKRKVSLYLKNAPRVYNYNVLCFINIIIYI